MRRRGRPRTPDILTPREWEVLDLLRQGLSNREIADRLRISYDGARYHVSEILSKLGVSSREEAAAWQPEASASRRVWGIGLLGGLLQKLPLTLTGKGLAAVLVGGGAAGVVVLAIGVFIMEGRTDEQSALTMGKVVYVVDGNIWVKDLPDGEPLQITDSGSDLTPQWSASGEWLIFSRETPPGGPSETWVIRADGTDARPLGRDAFPVSWSPVDDQFVYWS